LDDGGKREVGRERKEDMDVVFVCFDGFDDEA